MNHPLRRRMPRIALHCVTLGAFALAAGAEPGPSLAAPGNCAQAAPPEIASVPQASFPPSVSGPPTDDFRPVAVDEDLGVSLGTRSGTTAGTSVGTSDGTTRVAVGAKVDSGEAGGPGTSVDVDVSAGPPSLGATSLEAAIEVGADIDGGGTDLFLDADSQDFVDPLVDPLAVPLDDLLDDPLAGATDPLTDPDSGLLAR